MLELTTCRAQNAISGFVVFFATAYLNCLAATLALRISHLASYWDRYTGGTRLTDETEKRERRQEPQMWERQIRNMRDKRRETGLKVTCERRFLQILR